MKRYGVGFAAIAMLVSLPALADGVTPQPSPVTPMNSMPDVPSFGEMSMLFRQFEPEGRRVRQQLRVDLLSALTPLHRAAVGEFIGESALSEEPDANALARKIDAVLSSAEKRDVVAAFYRFLAAQEAIGEKLNAAMAQQFPQLADAIRNQHRESPPSLKPDEVGALLANWLLPQPTMLGLLPQGQPGEVSIRASFSPSSGEDAQFRTRLRSTVLAALTPAHREEVAAAMGRFAVSSEADREALSKQLLAMLSPQEQHGVVAAYAALEPQQTPADAGTVLVNVLLFPLAGAFFRSGAFFR